jgi:phosphatidylserine/phosphatidylglycerophosphate/cardiolipin synthase-like enzyme
VEGRALAQNPAINLHAFDLDDLAMFKHERSFPKNDSRDVRVFYAGRDDLHGVLTYLLARCSRSLKLNMFGYADEELDRVIEHLVTDRNVYVQGTLDKTQAAGVHERKILEKWTPEMRASFAIGQSETHDITHTKGGVIDGIVAFEGSTNWSAQGEGTRIPGRRYRAQNNTLAVIVHPVQVAAFALELDEEHATACRQQTRG